MKLALFLSTFLMVTGAFAQTLRAQKIKEEMLARVDTLVSKVEQTRAAIDKEDFVVVCQNINELFALYPDHLKAIGSHMNLFDGPIVTIKNEALDQLITFHKESLTCAEGKNHEYVNPKALDKKLKEIKKSLDKQKKRIKKSDTSYDNSFYYEYEF